MFVERGDGVLAVGVQRPCVGLSELGGACFVVMGIAAAVAECGMV